MTTVALATSLTIQALLVALSVVLLRPGTDILAERALGAEVLARRVDRPETQAALMRWLERTLLRTQDLGRAGGAQATRLGRDVTSRARRAGAERAARRR